MLPSSPVTGSRRLIFLSAILLVSSAITGCGEAQIGNDRASLNLAIKMQTAVMAKRIDLLERVLQEAETLVQTNQLPENACQVMREVNQLARSNDWPAAQKRWLQFAKAQRALPASDQPE